MLAITSYAWVKNVINVMTPEELEAYKAKITAPIVPATAYVPAAYELAA
jgi:hypothetical protein